MSACRLGGESVTWQPADSRRTVGGETHELKHARAQVGAGRKGVSGIAQCDDGTGA